mgnify:CR=1 FL=1
MTKAQIASMIDHTLLKAAATPQQITELCETAKALHTASVCVNPCHVALAAQLLKGSGVKVCTVIGFPLGANTTAVKASKPGTPSPMARTRWIWSSTSAR